MSKETALTSRKSYIAGKPLELLTDHGSQFYTNFGEIKYRTRHNARKIHTK